MQDIESGPTWVLRMKLGSSERVAGAHNCQAISLASKCGVCKGNSFVFQLWGFLGSVWFGFSYKVKSYIDMIQSYLTILFNKSKA